MGRAECRPGRLTNYLNSGKVQENSITDISALASCGRLRYIDIGVNRVTDISALAHCRKLWGVALPHNEVTDISALESCPRLEVVEIFGNPLTGQAAAVIEKLRGRGVKVYC